MEGLPANGAALMRVRARGASGEGGWSDVLQVHTRALVFGRPDPPHAQVARPLLRTSVKLRWATPRRPRSVAPMLFHRVRCSLLNPTRARTRTRTRSRARARTLIRTRTPYP